MIITYIYLPGRISRLNNLKQGLVPSEFYYGGPELQAKGHIVNYLEAHDLEGVGKLRILLEKLVSRNILPVKVYFSLIAGVKKLMPKLNGSNIIIATTPGIAFSLGILKLFRFNKNASNVPLIAIHCGILNYENNRVRNFISKKLINKMWNQLFGIGELQEMQKIFSIPDNRIEVNFFGVDVNFWKPMQKQAKSNYVLSVGNDSNRDYDSLVRAFRNMTVPLKIITNRQLPENLSENIEHLDGSWHHPKISDQKLRALYQNALCVVVPLKNSYQPSGQSVTLQSMACQTPVILTKTDGIWENRELINGENILFVDPQKPHEIFDQVIRLANDNVVREKIGKAGRQYVLRHGRISCFADRMEKICQKAFATGIR